MCFKPNSVLAEEWDILMCNNDMCVFSVGIWQLHVQGEGVFTVGLFHHGIFRVSNLCEIFHSIFRPLCELNPL